MIKHITLLLIGAFSLILTTLVRCIGGRFHNILLVPRIKAPGGGGPQDIICAAPASAVIIPSEIYGIKIELEVGELGKYNIFGKTRSGALSRYDLRHEVVSIRINAPINNSVICFFMITLFMIKISVLHPF